MSPLTLFFSNLFLHILDHLHFHVNFRISLLISTHKKSSLDCWQGLHRICRSIWGTHFHPYILNLLIHEYRLLFHLFRSLISFKRFIPKYFLKFSFKIYFLVVLGLHCCMRTFSSWAQLLGCTNLVALRHMGSSWTRGQTCVPCIGRQILTHWATREIR